ncbi:hypothetical protein [Vulcanisaeta souniana]|uniref:Uncharacterized protein n=1 Tax=Vulcanisaeta souniana JCM 11219 TaxID=1293586 RepID=A0A830E1L5_9CREN|nr:hypothetical protein [Vulcanisaeta souniana]BDR93488.1 hypothetical protein Vsou_25810 [Vulcanisaeta souniana JCM 11219]GGI77529.1 hypothetical protein GCM10007112_12930 [Vulcanisaeta souniana JCM 11219]
MVERLHANFYHNFMTREGFETHREAVLELVNKMSKISKNPSET